MILPLLIFATPVLATLNLDPKYAVNFQNTLAFYRWTLCLLLYASFIMMLGVRNRWPLWAHIIDMMVLVSYGCSSYLLSSNHNFNSFYKKTMVSNRWSGFYLPLIWFAGYEKLWKSCLAELEQSPGMWLKKLLYYLIPSYDILQEIVIRPFWFDERKNVYVSFIPYSLVLTSCDIYFRHLTTGDLLCRYLKLY